MGYVVGAGCGGGVLIGHDEEVSNVRQRMELVRGRRGEPWWKRL